MVGGCFGLLLFGIFCLLLVALFQHSKYINGPICRSWLILITPMSYLQLHLTEILFVLGLMPFQQCFSHILTDVSYSNLTLCVTISTTVSLLVHVTSDLSWLVETEMEAFLRPQKMLLNGARGQIHNSIFFHHKEPDLPMAIGSNL